MGIVGIFLFSLILHFWGLERFNALVFDEIYYAKYAHDYLTHTPFFDAHPPLGKYLIALGMWLSERLDLFPETAMNGLTGSMRPPWSYRWLNALVGSFLPLIVAGIAYELSQRRRFALLAGLFTAVDGLLLVESRYGLINIYLVGFGLLGHWFFLRSLRRSRQWLWLGLAGLSLGAAIAVKWNGLGLLLGLYLIWGIARLLHRRRSPLPPDLMMPLRQIARISGQSLLLYLGLLPIAVYGLVWIPHLQINGVSFWTVHQQIFNYHAHMGNGPAIHPYCSAWYTWPWMIRPMSYFYETTHALTDPLPPLHPPLPAGTGQVVYDVQAMGNPFLWWLSAIALLMGLMIAIEAVLGGLGLSGWVLPPASSQPGVTLYLVVNYAANFLPWSGVSRCTFIYLYLLAVVFGFLAIANLVDQWLDSPEPWLRRLSWGVAGVILLAFGFWLPIYLGLPLSPDEFRLRMWFPSWI
ncbi:hypothetical protein DO97_08550 [Neosynechococcus sphagnicola sy1]|uniref:Polyprenol-phosphate-mannose--protein mannosyltransferase n=1 Tax=Neosynechococcus sphagnicola sy1 TaxID=1497020 RepID=A0A098TIN4_9CYAN|nr:hypothetical protein DO97_08550 [Neosynechococcus sphagnicola sy1]